MDFQFSFWLRALRPGSKMIFLPLFHSMSFPLDLLSNILRQQHCAYTRNTLDNERIISQMFKERNNNASCARPRQTRSVHTKVRLENSRNLSSNLFFDVPCRNRKHVRPFNNTRKTRTRNMGSASAKKREKNIIHAHRSNNEVSG